MSLWSEILNHRGRLIHKLKHYIPAYEAHFGRYVNRPLTFLEIGCGQGGSLQVWKRYFGPHAQIIGIDIEPGCAAFAEDQVAVRIGDQSDPMFLSAVLDEFGPPHIVLDDGSHMKEHMAASFNFLYPRMAPEGVYMIEDLQTAYWPEYGGGLRQRGSFVELCKDLLDELNADLSHGAVDPTDFTRNTQSMHFYGGIAVFERGRTPEKGPLIVPPP
ncbi:MAG: class I SAM-dependent methyltransferase [Alphaproteobacteria bacterium]|nr:class I SAM-dependent methyltransferase [Alphaproteobacteria bacterium]